MFQQIGCCDSRFEQRPLKDRNELKDKQALGSLVEDIKAQIVRLREVAKLEAAAKDAQKRLITTKNKELSDKLVTNALRGRFAREVELKESRPGRQRGHSYGTAV